MQRDVKRAYALGVNSYMCKPINWATFRDRIKMLGFYWSELAETPELPPTPLKSNGELIRGTIHREFSLKQWKKLMSNKEFHAADDRADTNADADSLIVLGRVLTDKSAKEPQNGTE